MTTLRLAALRPVALLLWMLGAVAAAPARAQTEPAVYDPGPAADTAYGTGAGLEILLTNSGFGLGGYYHRALDRSTSLLLEASLGAGKDEREVKFFGPYFGRSYIPNKANYLLMLPAQAGLQRRLFQDQIEDNFRPYVQLSAGPTLGWEYPYFRDCDGDDKLDETTPCEKGHERPYDSLTSFPRGSLRFGFGGQLALGAHFGSSRHVAQGVRVGYAFTWFHRRIDLLEPDVPGHAQRFFGTPTISLTFGRLY